MAQPAELIAARTPPARHGGLWAWCQRHLWGTRGNAVVSVVLIAWLAWCVPPAMEWGLWHAVFRPDADSCQAVRGSGACWGVVAEKYRLILLGRYPFEEQWRPVLATLALVLLLVLSCVPACWKRGLALAWAGVWLLFFGLMGGGNWWGVPTGLSAVSTDQWGGLPLTLMLASLSIGLAFPLGVLVALGRQSQMPAIRSVCITYIELVRGVPLISVLFMASFMFPLLMPTGTSPDVLLRVLVGITLFSGAYTAEIVRGGLQAIPRGQLEAAATLGLGYWQTQRLVVLPQALAHVVPGLMNNFIAIFKDTSLVTIVSLYELSGSLGLAVQGDPNWRPFKIEGYLFITLIYFVFCLSLSRYSLWVERQVSHR
ncbi:amino acid ABC transporter permease [Limnohabitans sp. JirII-29]|uniref:amino acid ABC transporter permease n=1 Tax=Limnohabitans sp. JirII-29 TaxID=1835756 RepID=UPI000D3529CC|nr:amino acid ABC transporter permease [Limnohabitans sp. JirII-29]PUE23645.1 amino acid ABC transporter permease [Limnohabitans sp. JirII-29]